MYSEEEYLPLSGIQHFVFCRRQWALIHIEQQWAENLRTVEGRFLHQKVHDRFSSEKRGDLLISRGMPIHSSSLGFRGECDVVEFHRAPHGISIHGWEGLYTLYPIEYKKGKPKESDADILQVVAQAICLEEMLCCEIPMAYLYYGEIRRRWEVPVTDERREQVCRIAAEMHQFYSRQYTPKTRRTKACQACSLKDLCLPGLMNKKPVRDYIQRRIEEKDA